MSVSIFNLIEKNTKRIVQSNGSPIKFFTYQEAMAYCEKAKSRDKHYAPIDNLILK